MELLFSLRLHVAYSNALENWMNKPHGRTIGQGETEAQAKTLH